MQPAPCRCLQAWPAREQRDVHDELCSSRLKQCPPGLAEGNSHTMPSLQCRVFSAESSGSLLRHCLLAPKGQGNDPRCQPRAAAAAAAAAAAVPAPAPVAGAIVKVAGSRLGGDWRLKVTGKSHRWRGATQRSRSNDSHLRYVPALVICVVNTRPSVPRSSSLAALPP